jgi:hypothetical protein
MTGAGSVPTPVRDAVAAAGVTSPRSRLARPGAPCWAAVAAAACWPARSEPPDAPPLPPVAGVGAPLPPVPPPLTGAFGPPPLYTGAPVPAPPVAGGGVPPPPEGVPPPLEFPPEGEPLLLPPFCAAAPLALLMI